MALTAITEQYLTDIADSIRAKLGVTTTYKPSEMAAAIDSITGGGGGAAEEKQINFIDYDGTILHSYTASEWAGVSSLPANPSHTGLTAQGWNWTKAQIDAQLASIPGGKVWVGQMYVTEDGKTRIYIHLSEGRLSPHLGICPNGTVTVDWGDGTAVSTLTGTSTSTLVSEAHTYTVEGDYVITLTPTSGTFSLSGTSTTTYLLHKATNTTANYNRVYYGAIKKVELGTNVNIANYAFYYCASLETITIPSNVTSIGTYAFGYCYSLKSLTIPKDVTSIQGNTQYYCESLSSASVPGGVTSIATYAFGYCASLNSITIPKGVTSIGTYAFATGHSLNAVAFPSAATTFGNYLCNNCQSLSSVQISNGTTSIGNNAFTNCYALASVTIPATVTSIGNSAFSGCYGLGEIHVLPTTPPTLGNTSVFSNTPTECVFYVPAASLETYKTATNWSTHASKMVGE